MSLDRLAIQRLLRQRDVVFRAALVIFNRINRSHVLSLSFYFWTCPAGGREGRR